MFVCVACALESSAHIDATELPVRWESSVHTIRIPKHSRVCRMRAFFFYCVKVRVELRLCVRLFCLHTQTQIRTQTPNAYIDFCPVSVSRIAIISLLRPFLYVSAAAAVGVDLHTTVHTSPAIIHMHCVRAFWCRVQYFALECGQKSEMTWEPNSEQQTYSTERNGSASNGAMHSSGWTRNCTQTLEEQLSQL